MTPTETMPAAVPMSPAEELEVFVFWASTAFYMAERGQNPGVQSWWDAYHYVSTALSVGYANVFPVTKFGKALGGVVMTVGPALSARVFESAPSSRLEPNTSAQLAEILQELKSLSATLQRGQATRE